MLKCLAPLSNGDADMAAALAESLVEKLKDYD